MITNPFPEVIKDLYLDQSLVMKTLLVAYDLDSDRLASAMITTAQDLTKRTFSKRVRNFISERQMVMGNNLVITAFIVVTVIICGVLRRCLLLAASCANEVYCLVVKDFLPLVGGKVLGLTTLQDGYKRIVRNSGRCARRWSNTPAGDKGGTGGNGSGNRRSSSNSS